MHTLAWCDTLTNLNRTLDRRSLRELDMRVAFQMSSDATALVRTQRQAERRRKMCD